MTQVPGEGLQDLKIRLGSEVGAPEQLMGGGGRGPGPAAAPDPAGFEHPGRMRGDRAGGKEAAF